jgi:hypothetical protein
MGHKKRHIKPPLGLVPVWLIDNDTPNTKRIQDLLAAIHRYVNAGLSFPLEWFTELEIRIAIYHIDNEGL